MLMHGKPLTKHGTKKVTRGERFGGLWRKSKVGFTVCGFLDDVKKKKKTERKCF